MIHFARKRPFQHMPKYKHWNSVNHELFAPRLKCDHPSTCHPDRNEMEWRDLLKLQALPYAGYFCCLGRFLHSADATVGMTYVFALIVADTNVPQFWLTPDGGRLPPLHRIRPLWYRLVETAQRSKRGGRQIAAPTCTLVSGTIHPHRL